LLSLPQPAPASASTAVAISAATPAWRGLKSRRPAPAGAARSAGNR
jgi:hypothetical protein